MICDGYPNQECQGEARHHILGYDLCDDCARKYVFEDSDALRARVKKLEKVIARSIEIAEGDGRANDRLNRIHAHLSIAMVKPAPAIASSTLEELTTLIH